MKTEVERSEFGSNSTLIEVVRLVNLKASEGYSVSALLDAKATERKITVVSNHRADDEVIRLEGTNTVGDLFRRLEKFDVEPWPVHLSTLQKLQITLGANDSIIVTYKSPRSVAERDADQWDSTEFLCAEQSMIRDVFAKLASELRSSHLRINLSASETGMVSVIAKAHKSTKNVESRSVWFSRECTLGEYLDHKQRLEEAGFGLNYGRQILGDDGGLMYTFDRKAPAEDEKARECTQSFGVNESLASVMAVINTKAERGWKVCSIKEVHEPPMLLLVFTTA